MRMTAARRAAITVVVTAISLWGITWTASASHADQTFEGAGPHPVATAVRTNPCSESVYGMVLHIGAHLMGNRDDPTCTQAFPFGLESPIGVNTYYPADIADMSAAPLIVMMPGFVANAGMYDSLVRQWVSHGFVVVIPYDFWDSLAYVPAMGLAVAILAERDPASPLHGKIDLDHTILAGHSGGGQAALQAAAVLPGIASAIDPALHLTGVLAIEPGPLGLGLAITVPTLFLTGYNDVIVPDFAWVRRWEYNLTFNAPAWIANARGVSHASPIDSVDAYRSAGTAMAWLRYLAFDDADAKHLFVGADWTLPSDRTYFSVERNARADAMR